MLVPFGTHVVDRESKSVGTVSRLLLDPVSQEVEGVEVDEASGRITRIIVRRGRLFHTETAIPASLVASVGDTIRLDVSADEVKKLERSPTDQLGAAHARQRAG